jgi:hypothetical protein
MGTFNAWHEKIDSNGKRLSNFSSIIDNYRNIIDIAGKETLGISDSVLAEMEELSIKSAESQVKNAKVQMDTTAADLKKAKEELAKSEMGSDTYKYWEKIVKQLDQ